MEQTKLPEPDCELGYTEEQLDEIFGESKTDFYKWMNGGTVALCDGRSYDHPSKCGENNKHGIVTYVGDVELFLSDSPNFDW